MARKVNATTLWTAQSLGASSVATSVAIGCQEADAFAVYLTSITGTTPKVTFTYSVAPTLSGTFVTPQTPAAIGTDKAAADVLDFAPEAAGAIKIIATNTGTGTIVFSSTLVIQEAM